MSIIDAFQIRPLGEPDLDFVLEKAGGVRAHPDAGSKWCSAVNGRTRASCVPGGCHLAQRWKILDQLISSTEYGGKARVLACVTGGGRR